MNMITTLETPLLLDNFQMGKFNIRLIWEVSIYLHSSPMYVCKEIHFYANQNVYLFLTLNNRECFNSQHIRFIKSTNFTKKDDAGWERELRKCFNRLLKENKMRILFLPFNSTCWNIKHWESFRCLIQVSALS